MSRLKTDAIRNTSASADALTFDTNGNTKIADSEELQFGDSADLVIKHDGSHSYIKDTGTGSLVINANDFRVNNAAQSENMITAAEDGAVKLYNDHVLRFETHNAGYYCYGSGTASSHVFRTSDDTTRGSVYANNSNAIGFLDSGGDWAYQHTNDTGHKFFVQATECADLSHNGIKFNGDTAAANGLNDYEEGSFTPQVSGTTGSGSPSYTANANWGRYTKIGKLVHVQFDLTVSSWSGASGDLQIVMPLPSQQWSGSEYHYPSPTFWYINNNFTGNNDSYRTGYMPNNSTALHIHIVASDGSAMTAMNVNVAGRIAGSITYLCN